MVRRITIKSVLELSYVCIKSFVDTTKITNKKIWINVLII